MYLDIVSIDTGLKDVSFKYEFYKGETKVKEGNFTDTYLNSNTTTMELILIIIYISIVQHIQVQTVNCGE